MWKWLTDADRWMTRGQCGDWSGGLDVVYQVSSGLITVSYFAVACCMLLLWKRRQGLMAQQYPWMLLLFIGFFAVCGLSHLCDLLVFWWAPYRLFTVVLVALAVLSVAAGLALPWVVVRLSDYVSPEVAARLVENLSNEKAQKEELIDAARDVGQMVRREIDTMVREDLAFDEWEKNTEKKIEKLRTRLQHLRDGLPVVPFDS